MKITDQLLARFLAAIPSSGAPLRLIAKESGLHISNARTIYKILEAKGSIYTMRAGTGENSKHEIWAFTSEAAREAFEDKWLDEVSRRQKLRMDAKAAKRKAEREAEGRNMVAMAAERREARKRAERERLEAERAQQAEQRKSTQKKLRKMTAAAGALVFKGGTEVARSKKPAFAGIPATNPDNIQPKVYESKLRDRFAVDKAPSVISSRECRAWAREAVAA